MPVLTGQKELPQLAQATKIAVHELTYEAKISLPELAKETKKH